MQVDGYSLDAQKDKLRKYAEYEDTAIVGEYSDEGWSPIECRLELLKISDETYTDAGHAIEWCTKNAH